MRLISAVSQVRLLPPPPTFCQRVQLGRRMNQSGAAKESANEAFNWRVCCLLGDGRRDVSAFGTCAVQCQPSSGRPIGVADTPTSAAGGLLVPVGWIDLHFFPRRT